MTNSTIHEGENIRKLRVVLGLNQSSVALQLGKSWNQQRISYLENSRKIEISILNKIAAVFQVPVWLFQMPPQVFNSIIFSARKKGISCSEIHITKIVELYERLLISEWEQYILSKEL